MFGGEVAANGVRFPQHEIAVAQHRHHGVRVQREEVRIVGRAEAAAPVIEFERQADFNAVPQHLAHIDGAWFSEYFQHAHTAWRRKASNNDPNEMKATPTTRLTHLANIGRSSMPRARDASSA